MSKIRIMDENLANKIAAGEIVEKCSSVVKELVENSIDANSTNIRVDLIEGGTSLIKVTDNGIGMDKEDAINCFERHATSKIIKEDDLYFINSLGFRGEALPSIASVSIVNLKTSNGIIGTEINLKGGKDFKCNLSELRKGTIICIKNLFFNTPARLKFLKSPQNELTNCVILIEKLALSYPNINFTLTNNEKVLIKTSGSNDLLKTIHEIYGFDVSSKMLKIQNSNDDYELFGYISKPELLKSNRNHITTIVNGRIVKNNDLNRIINDAYYTYKPDTKYPIVVLKINTDPTLIDVNIHPTKQDIKLSKIEELSSLIITTIKDVLYKNMLIPEIEHKNNIEETTTINDLIENTKKDIFIKVKEEQETFDFNIEESKEKNELIKDLELYPIGIALGTYIIAQNDTGVYLIDQHAAQERINYEKNMNALNNEKINVAFPLIPYTIEVTSSDYIVINDKKELLKSLGFGIEDFGINTFIIKSHPTWLKNGYEEESIRKIFDIIVSSKNDFNVIKFRENVAITLACKLSIKGNERISMDAVDELLNELIKCDNPYNCPHGRPTIVKFSITELETMFKRIM